MKLIITLNGFERNYNLYTDDAGNWAYDFLPQGTEAGIYRVCAIHPSVLDRPDQGQFEIEGVVSRLRHPAAWHARLSAEL